MAEAPDFSARRAELAPQARAFTDHASARSWSFAEIEAEAQALAAWLRPLGHGARVGVLAFNRAETFVALFAARKAGVVLCPLNWRAPLPELAGVAASVGLSALIHDAAHAELSAALLPQGPRLSIRPEGGFGLPPGEDVVASLDEDAAWYLLLTSGTTGHPKAVIQTPRMAQAVAVNLAQAMELLPSDSGLCHLPLFHTAGINLFTLPLFQWGGHSHILPRHDLTLLTQLLAAGEVSQLFAVPTVWQTLARHPELPALRLDRLRGLASGGAALPAEVAAKLSAHGAVLRNGFGMTESGPTGFLIDRAAALSRPGSIGKPQLHTEARLAGVAGGAAGQGELLLRGATITPGYFGDPAATKAAFAGGWLCTGDLAARDAEGYYTILDRLKDMFVSGGENVWPAEVERVLIAHPDIEEAAVVARPDPKWGEVGWAYLRSAEARAPTTEELHAWCRAHLAAFKVPREFKLVADFPRTASGKIRKHLLKDRE